MSGRYKKDNYYYYYYEDESNIDEFRKNFENS